MYSLFAMFFALLLASDALCAPTTVLDDATLHQNALDAQMLNKEFTNIRATDPCDCMCLCITLILNLSD